MNERFDVNAGAWKKGELHPRGDDFVYYQGATKAADIVKRGGDRYDIYVDGVKIGDVLKVGEDRLDVYEGSSKTHELRREGDHYAIYSGMSKVGDLRPQGPDLVEQAFAGAAGAAGWIVGGLIEAVFTELTKPKVRRLPYDPSEPNLDHLR